MQKAYEYEVEYTADGRRVLKRKVSVGAVVVWGVVATASVLTGYAFLPPTFWSFFKP